MATVDDARTPALSGPDPSATLRRLKQQGTLLLPAGLAFLGFHVFLLTRGTLRLGVLQQFALFAGIVCSAATVVLFVVVLTRRPSTSERGQQLAQSLGWALAASVVALLVGASADIVLAINVVSGSWTIGAVAAGLLLAIACWICW